MTEMSPCIEDMPEEVLETILSKVSQYQDSNHCRLVNRRWRSCMRRVSARRKTAFLRGIQTGNLTCSVLRVSTPSSSKVPSITKRYSHCSVYHDKLMYVFGGCTSTSTTFNDLWALNLSTRVWCRCAATGNYPSPKACASMVLDTDRLYLFGGWTNPSINPLQISWRLFSELHSYDISSNKWTNVVLRSDVKPPGMAGHSATVHGKLMVVFGGIQKPRSVGHFSSSNDVWCFNLQTNCWFYQDIPDPKPAPRYGQSQLRLDDNHFLILGGCGGPNNTFNDVWLLEIFPPRWKWNRCDVRNPEFGAVHMWCHPSCKVGDYVVILCKRRASLDNDGNDDKNDDEDSKVSKNNASRRNVIPQLRRGMGATRRTSNETGESVRSGRPLLPLGCRQASSSSSSSSGSDISPLLNGEISIDPIKNDIDSSDSSWSNNEVFRSSITLNINEPVIKSDPNVGRMRAFASTSSTASATTSPSQTSPHQKSIETRKRQLVALKKIEQRMKTLEQEQRTSSTKENPSNAPLRSCSCHKLVLHVLNVSEAVSKRVVTWSKIHKSADYATAPEETLLYSLVLCESELVMFGGIQKDASSVSINADENKESVSNSTWLMTTTTTPSEQLLTIPRDLSVTLSNENLLQAFRKFLRSVDGKTKASPELKGRFERNLDFILFCRTLYDLPENSEIEIRNLLIEMYRTFFQCESSKRLSVPGQVGLRALRSHCSSLAADEVSTNNSSLASSSTMTTTTTTSSSTIVKPDRKMTKPVFEEVYRKLQSKHDFWKRHHNPSTTTLRAILCSLS